MAPCVIPSCFEGGCQPFDSLELVVWWHALCCASLSCLCGLWKTEVVDVHCMAYSVQTFNLTKPAFHVSVFWHSDKGEKYLTFHPAALLVTLFPAVVPNGNSARHQLLISFWLHVLKASITDQFLVTCAFICSIVSHKLIIAGGTVWEIRAHKKHHVCYERERELLGSGGMGKKNQKSWWSGAEGLGCAVSSHMSVWVTKATMYNGCTPLPVCVLSGVKCTNSRLLRCHHS